MTGVPAVAIARFDDLVADTSLCFPREVREVLIATRAVDVRAVLAAVDRASEAGEWAYGFVGYEAAPAFDPHLRVCAARDGDPPLAWFALCGPPHRGAAVTRRVGEPTYWCAPWSLDCDVADHAAAVTRIRSDIAAGDYYQANYTARLHGHVVGDLIDFYADLVHAQRGAFNALLEMGSHTLVSASPELFFEWTSSSLRCRPMKGTAARGVDAASDVANRVRLRHNEKDVAENVMIVDLLRNDLGRIGVTGSVRVPDLLNVEQYESVWQLTSQIEATPPADLRLDDIFAALFPCGSVTGAPKGAAMAAISELETSPRNAYCGAIGWVAPPGNEVRARFSVAIRTVTVAQEDNTAVYGSGGGITISSEPDAEYRELRDKTAVLFRASADQQPLMLLETFGWRRAAGFINLDRHLARLAQSADTFGVAFDRRELLSALHSVVVDSDADLRIALRLKHDGEVDIDTSVLHRHDGAATVHVAIDDELVDPESIWLRHKTNRRCVYETARARHSEADDVVLVNLRGEITESTIANVVVRFDTQWFTPPLECGCLPGVGRSLALDEGRVVEQIVTVEMLRDADEIALISSLRGWRHAVLL